jgi:hypothetical protein
MKSKEQEQIDIISNLVDTKDKINILLVLPESAGDIFLSTSLLESLKELYPESYIYYACKSQYLSILKNNPFIYKTIRYNPIMENQVLMEGTENWPGLFNISIMLSVFTQRYLNYLNNGLGKIAFQIRK